MEQNIQTNFLNIEHKAKVIPENKKDDSRKVKCYISPRVSNCTTMEPLLIDTLYKQPKRKNLHIKDRFNGPK